MNHRRFHSDPGVAQPPPGREEPGVETLDISPLIRDLRRKGFTLLQGQPFNLKAFETLTARFCDRFHAVGTRKPIEAASSDRYSSEVPGGNFSLFAHSEGAYRPWPPPPDLCFFNCVEAPVGGGGETLLVDGVAFLDKLPADLCERFTREGLIYQAYWEEARWKTEFALSSSERLEQLLASYPQITARFDGSAIEVRCRMDAAQTTLGGQLAFANGLLAHLPQITHPRWQGLNAYSKSSNRVFFGDGEEIPEEVVLLLIDIQDELAINHRWKEHDLLILDNARMMHGRRLAETDEKRVIRSRFGRIHPGLDTRKKNSG